jgi:hypothetical protein
MRSVLVALIPVLLALRPSTVAAQTPTVPPPPRADVVGSIGWLHATSDGLTGNFYRNDDWTRHATLTLATGIYWTEHWKSELSIGRSSGANVWDYELIETGSELVPRTVRHDVGHTRVSLTQAYQFGRNQWVHPSIGVGVLVDRRDVRSDYSPAVAYRGPSVTPVTIAPPANTGPVTTTVALPFVTAAVKAYVTPRAFVRSDVQVAFRRRAESIVAHAGFGFDF